MNKQIYVNLPVSDLPKARAFYESLGFTINEEYSDATAACIVISETIYVMLLTYAKFREFTPKAICDTSKATEVLNCLSCDSRAVVDELVRKAVAAGGTVYADAKNYDFMYLHSFQDLDGHAWELVYIQAGSGSA
ncbi:MAG: glyoxalase/bleomycin resistance/extradiol dioxygenase family protein [Verrucomicrobiota bacterium]|nr:glyoxalase/bleomycin resistance/extradiol dioxygenase family protein [Verrucomicrobiota bacterium]